MLKIIGTICFLSLFANAQTAQAQGCDRECLRRTLDDYLNAVSRHTPENAPLAFGFRQTENNAVVMPGGGLWATMTGLGKVQRRYMDVESGQAAYFGTVEEGDTQHLAIVGLRVRILNRKVTEAEWFVARNGDAAGNGIPGNVIAFDPANLEEHTPPQRPLNQGRRITRDEMTAVVNSYFDGLTGRDSRFVIAHPGCDRIENGFTLTGRELPPDALQPNGNRTTDCTSGLAGLTSTVAARRYLMMDEEVGVVLVSPVLLYQSGADIRRDMFFEFFLVDGAGIRNIYAAMSSLAQDLPVPNWPPYDRWFPIAVNAAR